MDWMKQLGGVLDRYADPNMQREPDGVQEDLRSLRPGGATRGRGGWALRRIPLRPHAAFRRRWPRRCSGGRADRSAPTSSTCSWPPWGRWWCNRSWPGDSGGPSTGQGGGVLGQILRGGGAPQVTPEVAEQLDPEGRRRDREGSGKEGPVHHRQGQPDLRPAAPAREDAGRSRPRHRARADGPETRGPLATSGDDHTRSGRRGLLVGDGRIGPPSRPTRRRRESPGAAGPARAGDGKGPRALGRRSGVTTGPWWSPSRPRPVVAVRDCSASSWGRCGWAGCPNVDRLRAYQPGKASRLLDRQRPRLRRAAPGGGRDRAAAPHPASTCATPSWPSRTSASTGTAASTGGAWSAPPSPTCAAAASSRASAPSPCSSRATSFPTASRARERTLGRKLLEVRVAYEIEDRFEKDEILELYLSHIYFGNGARGIEAAARHYFGTAAARLTLTQAALLAGLIRGPSRLRPAPAPRPRPGAARPRAHPHGAAGAHRRRRGHGGARDAPRRRAPARAPPAPTPASPPTSWRRSGASSRTASASALYDETLQRHHHPRRRRCSAPPRRSCARQLRAVEAGALGRFRGPRYSAATRRPSENGTPYLQGAVVALEVGTGDVLAWVGGRDFRHSRFDRVKSSRRQAGSAFKPFVYAAALGQGPLPQRAAAATSRSRSASTGNRVWEPKNFDERVRRRGHDARRARALEERPDRAPGLGRGPGGRGEGGAARRGSAPRSTRRRPCRWARWP